MELYSFFQCRVAERNQAHLKRITQILVYMEGIVVFQLDMNDREWILPIITLGGKPQEGGDHPLILVR
ncbi:MAG: hypothetical protein ACTSYI_01780 [Promethearchaeota archaeon]